MYVLKKMNNLCCIHANVIKSPYNMASLKSTSVMTLYDNAKPMSLCITTKSHRHSNILHISPTLNLHVHVCGEIAFQSHPSILK